ncbi:MAG: hypothetical protein JXX14_23875, partial [Deltaproteobacteria bacterium]|nr:hypothetical protein [Deltaproteobacteria bacterium]
APQTAQDDTIFRQIEAALNGVTFGEISKNAKGQSTTQAVAVAPRRLAAGYEQLRLQLLELNKRRSVPCSVLLLRLGSIAETRARADFSRGFFNPVGFEITESPLCHTVQDARLAARTSAADVIVICSTDDRYGEMAAEVAAGIRADVKSLLVLAGRPFDREAEYRGGGVDEFIYLGANHFELLHAIVEKIGGRHD